MRQARDVIRTGTARDPRASFGRCFTLGRASGLRRVAGGVWVRFRHFLVHQRRALKGPTTNVALWGLILTSTSTVGR